MSTTATIIITGALQTIGVLAQGETMSSAVGTDALRRLNMMLGSWSLQPLTKPVQSREVFALVDGQGGPDDPYTIGPGGDFNTARPAFADLTGAGLILGGNDPENTVEIPRAILTRDAFQAQQLKDLSSSLFTTVYYNPTYTSDRGSIVLWPVPDTAVNSIALYLLKSLTAFTSLSASYDLPRGLDEALEYNLAERLCAPFGRPPMPDVVSLARKSLDVFKTSNVPMNDLPQDFAWGPGGYDINTGNIR